MVAHKDTLGTVKKNGIGIDQIYHKLRFRILCLDVKDKDYLQSYRQRYEYEYCEVEQKYFVFSADMLWCMSKCVAGKDNAQKKLNFYSKIQIVNEFHDDIDVIVSDNRVKIDMAFNKMSNYPIVFEMSALSYLKAIYFCNPSEFLEEPKPQSIKIELSDRLVINKPAKEFVNGGYKLDYLAACRYAVVSYLVDNLK